MSQTCSKCNKVVKAFQRLLVYEPVKEPCKTCERPRPYPSAPPFGTTIKVCSFGEMERMCFPKLCDCPCREIPLCPEAKRRERICTAVYWMAAFALFAYLFDSGIFRHPVHTTRLTDSLKEMFAEIYNKEDAQAGKDEDEAEEKGKGGMPKDCEEQKIKKRKDPKREYDKAAKTYNIANVWNAAVIGTGDILIALVKLPGFFFVKAMEVINSLCEEEPKKGEAPKAMSHEKKQEPLKEEVGKEETKKEEPKKVKKKN